MDDDDFDMYGDLSEAIASKPMIDASLTSESGKGSAASAELVEEVCVIGLAPLWSSDCALEGGRKIYVSHEPHVSLRTMRCSNTPSSSPLPSPPSLAEQKFKTQHLNIMANG